MASKKSVMFVCMGNICRSPTGEGLFRALVEERGLANQFHIESSGTIGYHTGEPPDSRMRAAASNRGYKLQGRAQQFDSGDFKRFDLIVAMDRNNLQDILQLDAGGKYKHKVKLLCDFLENSSTRDVPDPYYGGASGFDRVLDMIEAACENILDHLQSE